MPKLSDAIAEWIEYRLRSDPDVNHLQPIALVPVPDDDDFEMVTDLARATASGSYVPIGTAGIAKRVVERYRAAPS